MASSPDAAEAPTPAQRARLVESLEAGCLLNEGARELGLKKSTVRRWMRRNPELNRELEAAMARAHTERMRDVANARTKEGEPDWHAAAWWLERAEGRAPRYRPRPRCATVAEERAAIAEDVFRTFERLMHTARDERIRMSAGLALIEHATEFAERIATTVDAQEDPAERQKRRDGEVVKLSGGRPCRLVAGGPRRMQWNDTDDDS